MKGVNFHLEALGIGTLTNIQLRKILLFSVLTKNWVSWLNKEMGDFIQAEWRIITREQPLRKLWELFCSLKVKAQLHRFFERGGCILNDVDGLHNPDLKVLSGGSCDPLWDQEGMLPFKKLSWRWQNVAVYGGASIPASGVGSVDA